MGGREDERKGGRPKGSFGFDGGMERWFFVPRQSEPLSHQEIGPPVCSGQTSSILIEGFQTSLQELHSSSCSSNNAPHSRENSELPIKRTMSGNGGAAAAGPGKARERDKCLSEYSRAAVRSVMRASVGRSVAVALGRDFGYTAPPGTKI